MDTFIEFKRRVRKLTEHRKHKVRNSLGVYDAYKWIRKNKWLDIGKALTEHEFYSIIRDVNNLISAEISLGKEVKLPNRMGSIELRKYDKSIKIGKDGKVVTPKSNSILPSITRRSILYVAEHYLGLETEEREVYLDEVKDFAECGLCGTAAVISPVGKIVDHGKEICFPSGMEEMGPVTKKLYETLTGIQMGHIEAPEGWI